MRKAKRKKYVVLKDAISWFFGFADVSEQYFSIWHFCLCAGDSIQVTYIFNKSV